MTRSGKQRWTRRAAPGVYRSSSGAYEIQYRDSDGRSVFRAVEAASRTRRQNALTSSPALAWRIRPRRTKATFGEFAETVIEGMSGRPRTIEKHRYHLDAHLLPRFRTRKLADLTTDDAARLIAEMAKGVHYVKVDGRLVRERRETGYAGWTTAGVVSTLGLVSARRNGAA